MVVSEIMFIMAMLNICFVSFIWTIKQILLLCHWYYEREITKMANGEQVNMSIEIQNKM